MPVHLSLYARLGVLTLSKDQLLTLLLLPRWAQLPNAARSAVLSCVKESWLALQGNVDLVLALGRTAFVTTGAACAMHQCISDYHLSALPHCMDLLTTTYGWII